MSKIDSLKEKYIADADAMASKSRFGYFTVLPSHTAGHNEFSKTEGICISIQLIEIMMVELLQNLQISLVEQLRVLSFRKTTFHIFHLPSMDLSTKILEK